MTDVGNRYIDLLKRCLTRELFMEEEMVDVMGWPLGGPLGDPDEVWRVLRNAGMRIVKPFDDLERRLTGKDWPMHAETMVGTARLDNVDDLVTRALKNDIAGDLVETGVWRGGVVILMRALLDALGDDHRRVWACDSFEGLPTPDPDQYPADAKHLVDEAVQTHTAVSLAQVQANIDRYKLLDDRIEFLPGWFRDTLPGAPIESIAVLRLDGDLYESTMDGLVHLEPKVSPGGFVIVDDYNSWEACRQAVTEVPAGKRDHCRDPRDRLDRCMVAEADALVDEVVVGGRKVEGGDRSGLEVHEDRSQEVVVSGIRFGRCVEAASERCGRVGIVSFGFVRPLRSVTPIGGDARSRVPVEVAVAPGRPVAGTVHQDRVAADEGLSDGPVRRSS